MLGGFFVTGIHHLQISTVLLLMHSYWGDNGDNSFPFHFVIPFLSTPFMAQELSGMATLPALVLDRHQKDMSIVKMGKDAEPGGTSRYISRISYLQDDIEVQGDMRAMNLTE